MRELYKYSVSKSFKTFMTSPYAHALDYYYTIPYVIGEAG